MSLINYYKLESLLPEKGKAVLIKVQPVGNPPDTGEFLLFPGAHSLKVKNRSDDGGQLELKRISRVLLRRGRVLLPLDHVPVEGRKALFLWKKKIAPGGGIRIHLRDNPALEESGGLNAGEGDKVFILSSHRAFIQIPGQLYSFDRENERGEALLLMAEPWSREEQKKMGDRISKNKNFPGEEAVFSMNLRVRGAMQMPCSLKDSKFEGAVSCASWFVMSRIHEKALGTVVKRSCNEGGIPEGELPSLLNLPTDLCREMVKLLTREGKVFSIEGHIINTCDDHRDFLSPISRCWLDELRASGKEGLPQKGCPLSGSGLAALRRRGLVRIFDQYVVDSAVYEELIRDFWETLPRDGSFALSDLKGSQGLSRSRLLLVLEELESRGLVMRNQDNLRTVLPDPEEK